MTNLDLFMHTPNPRETARAFVTSRPDAFRVDFLGWLEANWRIWDQFNERATRIWENGKPHYSARRIIESIRFDSDLQEARREEFKINGNYVPDLARLWTMHDKRRDGFFEFRVLTKAKRAA